jgi:hypothetical protein
MGYRELPVPKPKPSLWIDRREYDVDYFGMDDGRGEEPDTAFRFLFQLGMGLMIYLYVIQAGGRRSHGHFYHTFWLKDCAGAWIDMEEYGPPSSVRIEPCSLPVLYPTVTVRKPGAEDRVFTVVAQQFDAESEERLRMQFTLEGAARLTWTRVDGWVIEDGISPSRSLDESEQLLFG